MLVVQYVAKEAGTFRHSQWSCYSKTDDQLPNAWAMGMHSEKSKLGVAVPD